MGATDQQLFYEFMRRAQGVTGELNDALLILTLATGNTPTSIKNISGRSGLPRTTVIRRLAVLEAHGHVSWVTKGRRRYPILSDNVMRDMLRALQQERRKFHTTKMVT